MALSAHASAFSLGTGAAASTVAVTGCGFAPKALVFWWSGRTETIDTAGRASVKRGMGVATSPTDRRCVTTFSLDAAASSDTSRRATNDACIAIASNATSIDGLADLQSLDADGFTLVIDNAFALDYRISFLALGGSDLTDVATFAIQEPAATGNQDTTSLAFQPDSLLFLAPWTSAENSFEAHSRMCIGAAVSSSQQAVSATRSRDNQATMFTDSYTYGAECLARLNNTGSGIQARATFDSFLSNGFRLNWLEVNSTGSWVYGLALRGGQFAVGNLLTQTDTTTDIVESFGFQPTGTLLVSTLAAQDTQDIETPNDRMSIGAFSGTSARGAQASFDEDNVADSVCETAVEHDAIYANIDGSGVLGLMDIKSIDSGGFTAIMDDADPAQKFVWYLAVGSTAVAGSSRVPSGLSVLVPHSLAHMEV